MCFEAYMGYVFTIALNYLRHPDYKGLFGSEFLKFKIQYQGYGRGSIGIYTYMQL